MPVYLRFSGGRPWNTNSFCDCNKQNSCTMVRCSGIGNTTVGSCGGQCVQCGIFHPTCCNKSVILPQAVSCCCCRLALLLGRCSHTLISIDTASLQHCCTAMIKTRFKFTITENYLSRNFYPPGFQFEGRVDCVEKVPAPSIVIHGWIIISPTRLFI